MAKTIRRAGNIAVALEQIDFNDQIAMTTFPVRRATQADIEALVDFNCRLAQETEDKALDRELVARGVTRAFDQGDEAMYFVAELDDVDGPIGTLMLTREWSDWRDGWLVWIQSVYVVADYRGQGVFRTLLESATEHIKQDPDVRGLRLYVENENARAQSAYTKNGFSDPNYKVLEKLF